ncbi:MAG: L-seryl-tRNA(Sec) selenium transferase, partial [Actinomycetes bacterium]
MADDPRRRIPRTDTVLVDPRLRRAVTTLGPHAVIDAVHAAQQAARAGQITADQVLEAAVAALPGRLSSLRPVINATGVVVHTNLGRAPLSLAARDALLAAAGSTDVEFDLAAGTRSTRRGQPAMAALRRLLPDASDVHVVNNNAAALVLVATALARGREVLISRGELVEIGDGFRIPDLLAATGARLREVGSTNRTHLGDYAEALGPDTALILKVHPSNFTVSGFTASVPVEALAALGPPVVYDLGSGLLAPDPLLPDEPDASTALRSGASLVTASGDKLLGGPQAGLIAGRSELVHVVRRHPVARAFRVDKLTLAALEATLRGPAPPVVQALHAEPAELRTRAEQIAAALPEADARVVPSEGVVGGGGAP